LAHQLHFHQCMKKELTKFILDNNFPCVMAKAILKKGFVHFEDIDDLQDEKQISRVLKNFYRFIDKFRNKPDKLSSFILSVKNPDVKNFMDFENQFWKFLERINSLDKKKYAHDPRVNKDPMAPDFSFSLKEEAFFVLALHPESERLARRFSTPTIVFNPHRQFEELRNKGVFKKVRDLIRKKDELLQGFMNPMLADFGEKSEVFQYLGKKYPPNASIPLHL
jgi:FPC/CPF motif-containing protein YcgG